MPHAWACRVGGVRNCQHLSRSARGSMETYYGGQNKLGDPLFQLLSQANNNTAAVGRCIDNSARYSYSARVTIPCRCSQRGRKIVEFDAGQRGDAQPCSTMRFQE